MTKRALSLEPKNLVPQPTVRALASDSLARAAGDRVVTVSTQLAK